MHNFGKHISVLAAASLLFANLACACAFAAPNLGERSHHHVDAHHHHHHGQMHVVESASHCGDASCHDALSLCSDCGDGISLLAAKGESQRFIDLIAPDGEWLAVGVPEPIDDTALKRAPPLQSLVAGAALPPRDSPITRKDKSTE